MTNTAGTTFIRGQWYNCHYCSYFFQYLMDRVESDGGVYTIQEYINNKPADNKWSYISNSSYLEHATLATPEELAELGIIPTPYTNDSYSVF